jgi:hypothetical protein
LSTVVIQLELCRRVPLVQRVHLGNHPGRGLEPVPALEEGGGRAERAGERAAPAGLDPHQVQAELRDRVGVVVQPRQRVQIVDPRCAGGLVQPVAAAPADPGNLLEPPARQRVQHRCEGGLGLVPDDHVEHRVALQDLGRQHGRVRAAEQDRQLGPAPLQLPRDAERVEEAAAERGEADRVRLAGQQRLRRAGIQALVVGQFAVAHQPLRIPDGHGVPGRAADRCQRQQPEVRMHVQAGQPGRIRKHQVVDQRHPHGAGPSPMPTRPSSRSCA